MYVFLIQIKFCFGLITSYDMTNVVCVCVCDHSGYLCHVYCNVAHQMESFFSKHVVFISHIHLGGIPQRTDVKGRPNLKKKNEPNLPN